MLSAIEAPHADIFDLGLPVFEAIAAQDENKALIITAMVEDLKGFIWVADQEGLRRFDGYKYKVYRADAQSRINIDSIYSLAVDNNNNIWVGMANSGLAVLLDSTGKFTPIELPSTKVHLAVHSIINHPLGGMWVGTSEGLYLLDDSFTVIAHHLLEQSPGRAGNHYITALLLDKEQQLWVGSSQTLYKLAQDGVMIAVPVAKEGLYVLSLFEDSNGDIWVGTDDSGQLKLDPAGRLLSKFENYLTKNILEPKPGEVWLGTNTQGVVVVDINTDTIIEQYTQDITIPNSLGGNYIGAAIVDRAGLIWLGTWGQGLYRFNPHNIAFANLYHSSSDAQSLSKSFVGSIQGMSDGRVLFLAYGHGVDLFEPTQGRVKSFEGSHSFDGLFDKAKMIYMTEGPDKDVWMSIVNKALVRYTPEPETFETISEFADTTTLDVLWEAEDSLLVMTYKGLKRFNPLSRVVEDFYQGANSQAVDTQRYRNLTKTSDGRLWMNSGSTIFVVMPNSSLIHPVSVINSAYNIADRINGISVDSHNNLFFSNRYNLFKFSHWQDKNNHQGVFESIVLKSQELELPTIAGELFASSDKQLWGGKFAINPQSGEMDHFGLAEGIGMEGIWENTKEKTQSGTLLFGASSGVVMIRPELYKKWDYMPPVVITDAYIDSKNVHIQDEHLTLFPDNKRVSIDFSALDYTAPTKNKYAYRLQGDNDHDWHYVDHTRRSVSFTNLAPGDYNLQIKGTNRKGEWSDDIAQLSISVLPAWFQTWWFRTSMVLAFALLLMLLFKWRVRQMTAKRIELEMLVKQRTLSLEQQTVRLEEKSNSLELKTVEATKATKAATSALDQLLLTQNQLVESEKHASLGRLVVGVSHELNTPLGVAKLAIDQLSNDNQGLTQMMQSGALSKSKFLQKNEAISKASELVRKNVDRAADLVRRFKTLSTQQSSQNVRELDVVAHMDDLLITLGFQYSEIKGRIHVSATQAIPMQLDVTALDKVIGCLLDNAMQHAFPTGLDEAKIVVTLSVVSNQEQNLLVLSFHDNGCGIEQDVLPLIFDPFYTSARDTGAVGLGLHAAFNLVTQSLKGSIDCSSIVNEGTEFTLAIPIAGSL